MAVVILSLLPIGFLQTVASVNNGKWYPSSAEFMQVPHMHVLKWLRLVGDTIFTIGTVTLCWFVYKLDRKSRSQSNQKLIFY